MALTFVAPDSTTGQTGQPLRRRRRSCGRGDVLGGLSHSATSSQRRPKMASSIGILEIERLVLLWDMPGKPICRIHGGAREWNRH